MWRVTSEDTDFERESELIDQLNPRLGLFEKNIRLARQLFTNLIDSFLILVTLRYSERARRTMPMTKEREQKVGNSLIVQSIEKKACVSIR